MKPILLHGHERPITQIKYNREGDLLFSSAKDQTPNVWYSLNGERLGTLQGHVGAVWTIDVNWLTTRVMTGAADSTLRIWDCETGSTIGVVPAMSTVRTCAFSYSANLAVYSTDTQLKQQCEIAIIDVRNADESISNASAVLKIPIPTSKVTSILWGAIDETLISGHENGEICLWDVRNGKKINAVTDHSGAINDMQMNKDCTMFVTASKDTTAKLFDSENLMCLKVYKTERPVNSAAISPILDHVVLGGGQEAMEVTTTSTRVGKFDSRFYHLVFEEEFGRIKGHFGPIHSIAFHPDGKSYSTGGEDGYIRVHTLDPSYFEFCFDY